MGTPAPDRGTQYLPYMLLALIVALAPHVLRLPMWILAWDLFFWGYAWGIARLGWLTPGPKTRQLFTFCGFIGGLAAYGFSFDLDAGVGLLCLMVGLKPLEIRNHRDRMMTLFLSYFLVITNLFYSNALGMTLYLLVSAFITTAVLIRINHAGGGFGHSLRTAGRILVLALPVTIGLFVFFPRLYGGLWGVPRSTVGKIGFTDRLTPGSVAELVDDAAIAFRVEFEGPRPRQDQLYWRGIVFTHFDGRTWRPGDRSLRFLPPLPDAGPVAYAVTLEPHRQRWLFALDRPFESSRRTRIFADGTLRTWRKVNALFRYTVVSHTRYHTGAFRPEDRPTRDLPEKGNPEARALARQWANAAGKPIDIVNRALAYFRGNRFRYTLQAPPVGPDIVDDFLFRTRQGYCEHYAAAFAFLMRAAGVPARIVGGYLGGEKNPYAEYLIVRQADAHAWVEVWLPETGWTRVDPTSVVAPARVSRGTAAALTSAEREALWQSYTFLGPLAETWKNIQFGWDLANNHWNQRVIIYSRNQQRALFSGLGLKVHGWKAPAAGLAATLGVIGLYAGGLGLLSAWRRRQRPRGPIDETLQTYLTFCLRLAGAGLPRAPFLGPRDYARSVIAARPDLERDVRQITDLYVNLRYARGGDPGRLRVLKSRVRRFKPSKNGPQ